MNPGIYDMSAAEYHADPADAPSLSASIAHALCAESPLHAWTKHRKLNPDAEREEAERMDIGNIAHALLLQGMDVAEVISEAVDAKGVRREVEDWKLADAKRQRDAARAAGKIPILRKHWDDVQLMVAACRIQLQGHREAKNAFTAGKPEQTLIWQEDNGVICRARVDWLHDSYAWVDDYKSTGATANPEVVSRTLFQNGYDIQGAFYCRGVEKLTGKKPNFRLIYQETFKPYAVSVVGFGPDTMMLAEKKVLYAIEKFGQCLETGLWPGYPDRTCYAVLPGWEETRWLEKELSAI